MDNFFANNDKRYNKSVSLSMETLFILASLYKPNNIFFNVGLAAINASNLSDS